MNRLEVLSTDLAAKLLRASAPMQRTASLMACEFAVKKTEAVYPLVDGTLQKLRSGYAFDSKERREIEALSASLDDEYFNLQEASESGKAPASSYMHAFAKARAVAALFFATADDTESRADAIYEAAAAAGEDKIQLLEIVEAALNKTTG